MRNKAKYGIIPATLLGGISRHQVEGLIPGSPPFPFHPNGRGQQAMARQVLAALGR